MKKILLKKICFLLICATCTFSLSAQTPRLISYQGLLTDAGGSALADGNYAISISIYDVLTGGTPLWTEAQNITLTNGIFNILLGEITSLDLPFDKPYYLGTTFDGNELSPRTAMTAAPYTIGTGDAKPYALDAFGGGTENVVFVDASTSVGIGTESPDPSVKLHVNGDIRVADDHGIYGLDALWGYNDLRFFGNLDGSEIVEDMVIAANGNVGIGVTFPQRKLHIRGQTSTDAELLLEPGKWDAAGDYGQITFGDINHYIRGEYSKGMTIFDVDNIRLNSGVGQVSIPSNNLGIGVETAKTRLHVNGDYYGRGHLYLYAYEGDGNSGTAYVQARDDSGTSDIGLKLRTQLAGINRDAISISPSGNNMSLNNSMTFDDTALNISSANTNDFALYLEKEDETFLVGFVNNGNVGIGDPVDFIGLNVKTESDLLMNVGILDGADVLGITSNRQVLINGSLSVSGSKNFILDHPLDPANKSLVHNAVESPDRITQYQGTVKLDADGTATVELPDYFEALNKGFHYQLTCVGGFAQVYIASEIAGNQFRIAGGQEGLKVSWQVTATRNDPYARDHVYEPVIEKKGRQKGKYWYPQGYNQDESMGMRSYDEKDVLSKRNKK